MEDKKYEKMKAEHIEKLKMYYDMGVIEAYRRGMIHGMITGTIAMAIHGRKGI